MRLLKYFVFILGASEALAQVGMFQPAWLAQSTSTLYPTQVAGIYVWLKPGKQAGFSDGDPVDTVLDYSGNGNHFIASALERPSFTNQNPTFNNHGTLWFNGITNQIYSSNLLNTPIFTMFMVGHMSYIDSAKVFLYSATASNNFILNTYMHWLSGGNAFSYLVNRDPYEASFDIEPAGQYWATNNPFTVVQFYDGTWTNAAMKTNGVYVTPANMNFGNPGIDPFLTYPSIFGYQTNAAYTVRGVFAEFILYTNVLTTNQIESIEHYLNVEFNHY